MTDRSAAIDHPRTGTPRITPPRITRRRITTWRIAVGAVIAGASAYGVWFLGFDPFWAVATVLAVAPVVALLATLKLEEEAPWDPSAGETPRGIRITVAILEQSLAACDRLARLPALRRLRALFIPEREDRLARATLVRRTRALLVAELRTRNIDPEDNVAVMKLLGPDALAILQPQDNAPVTPAAIERCLDAVEQLGTHSKGSA
jgi:hypothetical protein